MVLSKNDYARIITIDGENFYAFLELPDKYLKFTIKDSVLMGMTDAIDEIYEVVSFTGTTSIWRSETNTGNILSKKLTFAFGKLLDSADTVTHIVEFPS